MNEKELIDLIFLLRSDIWQSWGYFITVNLAICGWLLHRHGLYGTLEKVVSSIGYSFFVAIMLFGMFKAYSELDSIADEFAYMHISESNLLISPNGIKSYFISKSPSHCHTYKIKNTNINCKKYSSNLYSFVIPGMFGGWVLILCLFWYESMWEKSRKNVKET